MLCEPTIAAVIPETWTVTFVPFAWAVEGVKLTVVPAGFPKAEKVVTSLNPKKVLYVKI